MEAKSQTTSEKYAADISSIREAQVRINPFICLTPVLSSETLNSISGRKLIFKCECFQKGGAFKFRGASNAIFSLDEDQAAKGVVTHSSGNHAAAVSLAAKLRGIPAYIVIPRNAPKCKVENVVRYGGQVIWSEATMQSREETATKVLQETGAVLVHPYNDPRIIRYNAEFNFVDLDLSCLSYEIPDMVQYINPEKSEFGYGIKIILHICLFKNNHLEYWHTPTAERKVKYGYKLAVMNGLVLNFVSSTLCLFD